MCQKADPRDNGPSAKESLHTAAKRTPTTFLFRCLLLYVHSERCEMLTYKAVFPLLGNELYDDLNDLER